MFFRLLLLRLSQLISEVVNIMPATLSSRKARLVKSSFRCTRDVHWIHQDSWEAADVSGRTRRLLLGGGKLGPQAAGSLWGLVARRWLALPEQLRALSYIRPASDSGTCAGGALFFLEAAPARPTATVTRQVHGFRVLTYNAGGITTAVWDELMIYLPSRADIVVLTESHWELDREFQVADWHVMHAGLSRRQAGVMVLLKRNLFHAEQIKHSVLVSGRLLHVRLTLATEVLDILACYQHAWNGYLETEAKQQLLNQRASFWTHLSMALRNMPRRNRLLVMGDFNARCTPFDGLVGPGTLHRFHDEHRDDNEFQHLLQANRLCVLNTWGRRAATYESDTARSQIDFILQPAYQVRSVSKHCTVHTACPVAAWRGGGRHFPVSTVVPASRGRPPWVKGEQGLSTKDGQRIAEWLKANRTSEAAQRFENSVSQELGLLTEYDPKQVNTILLREGAKLLPRRAATGTSIAGSLRGSITDMWLWYKQSRTRQSPNPLQDCLRRWAARAKFQSMHRAVQAAGRRKRRERYAGILRDAEVAVQSGKPAALLQVIKRLSPKIPKRRWQLRSEGQLLGPQAAIEAVSTFWRQIYQAPALESTETAVQLSVEERDIRDALARLPSGKAVPAHYAPSVLWRLAAGPLAALAHRAITGCWSAGVSVPAVWQAAWISFLPKSAAIPRSPGDLRPIGLLDPLGKAVLSHLKRLIHPTVARHLREVPQYAYLPLRSTHQAIARVAAHCRKGRSLATAPRPKLVLRHRGLPPRRCSGAIQLSVDLRKAFDSLDRGKLFQCLVRAGVDDSLAHTVLQWHQQVSYYIRLDGHESHFLTGKGVRQGCPIAPTIWIAFLDLMVDLLKGRLGSGGGEWIRNNLTCFADDMHAGLLVHSEEDLNRSLEELGALLSAVEALGLEINPAKSAVLLRNTCSVPSFSLQPRTANYVIRMATVDSVVLRSMESPDRQIANFFRVTFPDSASALQKDPEDEPPTKWQRKDNKGNKGKGRADSWKDYKRGWQPNPTRDEHELVQAMGRLLLKHEDQLRMLETDRSWVLHFDTSGPSILAHFWKAAEGWRQQQKSDQAKLTASLRTTLFACMLLELKNRLLKTVADSELLAVMQGAGYYQNQVWMYQKWNAEKSEVEIVSEGPGLTQSQLIQDLDKLLDLVTKESVVHRFHGTRPLAESYQSPALVFLLTLTLRPPHVEALQAVMGRLEGCAALRLIGTRLRRERMGRQPAAVQLSKLMSHPGSSSRGNAWPGY
ncbi:LINE-1 retrotransposable element ORF2 protein [Symbiodinium microadriaticum]|uniref:LINE-1 retrotransposable element ORF2 protein n=1 Tax=Symbiodinium microadriaticum TaxID=2951 RepID=A0A1Q9DXU4_SYMMI|nr:LINE-1 retrotransposable element ORF2 protein [Symbiodinium microadriaticum]CAE7453477.1 Pol [Symbiodinium sp. KB8]CAE7861915.1 Pol [Symbiodinium microadriaticum]